MFLTQFQRKPLSMKEIVELVHLLESVLAFKQDDWDVAMKKLRKNEALMLELLLNDRDISDVELAHAIATTSDSIKYKRCKRALNEYLGSLLISFSPSEYNYNSFQRNYYRCNQYLATLRVLQGLTYNHLAKPVADRLIILARKYYFNEARLAASQYLAKYYSLIKPDTRKMLEYDKEAELCLELLRIENYARQKSNYFLALRMSNKREDGNRTKEFLAGFLSELKSLIFPLIESYRVYHTYFEKGFFMGFLTYDYNMALEYSKNGYNYFDSLPFNHVSAKSGFLSKMSKCYLELGELDLVIETQLKALESCKEGNMNWFIGKYQLIAAHLHRSNFKKAYDLYKELIKHRNFKNQNVEISSFTQLAGAYLEFLIAAGVIDTPEYHSKFRLKRFLNEVPHFDNDKNPMKISLIVIQLLFNIHERDYDAMESRIYSLKDFCSRRLVRKSPNFRSNCFIKMLLEVPLNNFNPIAVSRKTERYHKMLVSVAVQPSKPIAQVEVIPYEKLWEIILDHLESPKRKRKTAMAKSMFLVG